jgi:M6 family metalloprotease-like protein
MRLRRVAVPALVALVLTGALLPLLAGARHSSDIETVDGRLHVVHVDPIGSSGEAHERQYLIDDSGNVTELVGEVAALGRESVTVSGIRDRDNRLHVTAVTGSPGVDEPLDYWQVEPLLGDQHWVTILCDFPGSDAVNWRPVEHFERLLSVDWPGMGHYFNEVSYGAIQIVDPVVAGWYQMPEGGDAYREDGYFDQVRATEDCVAAADADVYFPDFDGVNLVFNDPMSGLAYGGSWSLALDGASRSYPMTWLPTFGYLNQNVFAHEMGHAFGLQHTSGPYEDVYDSMWDIMSGGGNCNPPHPDFSCVGVHPIGVHKDMLGWLPAERRFVAASPSSQSIELERLAQPDGSGYLVAFVPIQGSLSQFYTVETRLRVGYDTAVPAEGVVIHRFDLTGYDRAARVVDPDGNGDANDDGATWLPGETFNDAVNGIRISIESAGQSSYQVRIDVMDAYTATWQRTDRPVSDLRVDRTWMWGPEPFTGTILEPYLEGSQSETSVGLRAVRYYDKSRMEITDPRKSPSDDWYVTNGLLVVELITGRLQLGDNEFEQLQPAAINVAGDASDPNGPTYATFGTLLDAEPYPSGTTITTRLARDGSLVDDPALAARGVTAAHLVDVPGIRHQVASPFWTFLNSSSLVDLDGDLVTAPLFEPWFYATGYPISEAYWAEVQVAGVAHDVLMQCFERRCLTYTPDNPDGWQVEAGNVGRHYYAWRYEQPEFSGQIAYVRGHGNAADIYVIEPGDAAPRNLSNTRGSDTAPAWSPDGSQIAFASQRAGTDDIYVMDADGTNVRQLTFGMEAHFPSWSPDGTEIAFMGVAPDDSINLDVWIVAVDGGEPRRLTTDARVDSHPDWSPDGTKIVFTSDRDLYFNLYTIGVDGSNETRLTDAAANDHYPDWSPDGGWIVFERHSDFDGDIFVVDADGTNARNLTNHPGWDAEPVWSPDGTMIAFSSSRRAGGEDLYLMNADGSDQRNLTNRPGPDYAPSWGP